MRAGASGYLLKDSRKQELAEAVRAVASGNTCLSPQVSRHIIDSYVHSVEKENSPLERLDIHDVAGLVRFAIKMGLVTLSES